MRTKNLRWIAYPTARIIWNFLSVAVGREETIHAINRLRKAGCDLSAACAERGISRATYYRWQQAIPRLRRPRVDAPKPPAQALPETARWSTQDERLVWQLRRAHPTYGKLRLWRVLVRDHGFTASASTVGRILARGQTSRTDQALRVLRTRTGQTQAPPPIQRACQTLALWAAREKARRVGSD